jgi:tetratricopeptide (TPR) repeat protein
MYGHLRSAVLLLVLGVVAASAQNAAELKARADAAHGANQIKPCLEYARAELETANDLFNKGEADQGQADIQEVVKYARQAADAAGSTGKHLKDAEIKLRRLAERMHDIGESLAFEDRQPVRQAVDELQKIRSDLIVKMWGPDAEPKGSS